MCTATSLSPPGLSQKVVHLTLDDGFSLTKCHLASPDV